MHGLEQNTDNFIDDILLFSPEAFSHRKILRDVSKTQNEEFNSSWKELGRKELITLDTRL